MSKKKFLKAVTALFDGKVTLTETMTDTYRLTVVNINFDEVAVSISTDGIKSINSLADVYGIKLTYSDNFKQINVKHFNG